jgi:hypothetical protein
MQKLNDQLENIKARANRQSKSSRDKLNILANERQRPTFGEYRLETIQEIHDEIADVERLSNFISKEDDNFSEVLKKELVEIKPRQKPKINDMSIISQKNNTAVQGKNMKDSELISINAVFKAASEHGQLDRQHRPIDDTLPCKSR